MMKPEMLDCDAVMRQLWDFLDGELTPDREAAIRAHLDVCKLCHPQHDFEKLFLRALSESRREHSSPEKIKDRVLAVLRAEGFAAQALADDKAG
jgi:anti-sigma factor (TIGR02949 family)